MTGAASGLGGGSLSSQKRIGIADSDELFATLAPYRSALMWAAGISGALNILMLSGSFFMLLVYDSVLPSRSAASLVGLLVLVLLLYGFQTALDILRTQILLQVGGALDQATSPQVYGLCTRRDGQGDARMGDGLQPLRDLDQLRNFIAGQGVAAVFDLPWILIYLGFCFLFHVMIGLTAVVGGLAILVLALLTDRLTREPVRLASEQAALRNGVIEADRHNAELLRALGMRQRMAASWAAINSDYRSSQSRAASVGGSARSVARVARMALQSIVLAVGAWLVLRDAATAGVIVAASILTSRALAPIEQITGDWRSFVATRQAWGRLATQLTTVAAAPASVALPPPTRQLTVERLSVGPPNAGRVSLVDVAFSLTKGDALGVIGPSASGKSTLARALVGVWPVIRGAVRLDGATLDQWDDAQLGRHLGYVPQHPELFAGTIGENIARFEPNAQPQDVIRAAEAARVHDLILRLPEGYETRVGPNGGGLSAGQVQRIALARAFFRQPFLVVLDEPNSNLDADGELALSDAVMDARQAGCIVVLIAHRPSSLAVVNKVLVLGQGQMKAFGDRDEVLKKISRSEPPGGAQRRPSNRGAP